jgi:phosphoesterase RecJ-like protein
MVEPILSLIREQQRFVITTHVRPDGDAAGSQLALGLFLKKLGKQVAMINSDPTPDNLLWMPGMEAIEVFEGSFPQHERIARADVIFVVDTNALERLGTLSGPVRHSGARKVLIDHHTEPEGWFDLLFARDTASSTGELVYELIAARDPDLIDETIARALYAAILTDTGSFRYSSVTSAVHRIAADLMDRGQLQPDVIYAALYETRTPESLRLLALVLQSVQLHYDGQLSHMVVSQRMLNESGASYDDTEGFVNYALALEGVQVALIFTEVPSGTKISFRSKGLWYVNDWARAFGGGGHRNAAGAFVRAPLEEVIQKVIASAPRYLALETAEPPDAGALSPEDADYLSTLLDLKARNPHESLDYDHPAVRPRR